jgi:EthD domain
MRRNVERQARRIRLSLWFDSVEDAEKAFTAPRYLEIIRSDEKKLIDFSSARVVIAEEVAIYEA